MPIYEYACPDCGHRFEEIQRFSDDPIRLCPKCKQENVKKLVSASSFVLKGGGWYKDHYGLKTDTTPAEGAAKPAEGAKPAETAATPAAPAAPAATPAPAPAASSTP